jgi:hypothetical protein
MNARARLVTRREERAKARAEVNNEVLSLAPTVPYMWDFVPALASAEVRGVQNLAIGGWDLNFTSLRRDGSPAPTRLPGPRSRTPEARGRGGRRARRARDRPARAPPAAPTRA